MITSWCMISVCLGALCYVECTFLLYHLFSSPMFGYFYMMKQFSHHCISLLPLRNDRTPKCVRFAVPLYLLTTREPLIGYSAIRRRSLTAGAWVQSQKVRVKFVLVKIARDRLFSQYLAFRYHCRSTSAPYLFTYHRRQIILAIDIVVK